MSSDQPDANALMNPAEGFKDEEAGVLNEVLQASNQEKVIHKNLRKRETRIDYRTNISIRLIIVQMSQVQGFWFLFLTWYQISIENCGN